MASSSSLCLPNILLPRGLPLLSTRARRPDIIYITFNTMGEPSPCLHCQAPYPATWTDKCSLCGSFPWSVCRHPYCGRYPPLQHQPKQYVHQFAPLTKSPSGLMLTLARAVPPSKPDPCHHRYRTARYLLTQARPGDNGTDTLGKGTHPLRREEGRTHMLQGKGGPCPLRGKGKDWLGNTKVYSRL